MLGLKLPEGATTFAYADDLALLTFGKSREAVQEITQYALDSISNWMRKNSLALAPEKTETIVLLSKRGEDPPNLTLEVHTLQIKKSARYLGVILQQGLKTTDHIKKVTEKATKASMDIARILPRTYGASEAQRRVVATVAESIALYAAPIWATEALRYQTNS